MSHLSPFRLNVPNLGNELASGPSNPKKRRKNVQSSIQTTTNVQDLLPPPLSGYGDTIVASNPFDDCPSSVNSMNVVRNTPTMGMGNNMGMNMSMSMCRPMAKNHMAFPNQPNNYHENIGPGIGSPMLPSPNAHPNPHMMNNPMVMNGPRMNGPMGNHMGPHMMNSPNGPMHPIAGMYTIIY